MKKAIYVVTFLLLGGALIIQSVWGADARQQLLPPGHVENTAGFARPAPRAAHDALIFKAVRTSRRRNE